MKTLLFLCQNADDGKFANSVFEDEGKKMDVAWTSAAKPLEDAKQDDLSAFDLVIVLRKEGALVDLKNRFATWSGQHEVWDISGAQAQDAIKKNIARLLVSLILQGGKRQPAPDNGSSQGKGTQIGAGAASKSTDSVRVSRETKGRGGKTVTVISGLTAGDAEMQKLATRLKQLCGTGGTIKDGKIEIQGDQCDRILSELQSRGYKAKRSGG